MQVYAKAKKKNMCVAASSLLAINVKVNANKIKSHKTRDSNRISAATLVIIVCGDVSWASGLHQPASSSQGNCCNVALFYCFDSSTGKVFVFTSLPGRLKTDYRIGNIKQFWTNWRGIECPFQIFQILTCLSGCNICVNCASCCFASDVNIWLFIRLLVTVNIYCLP